MLDAILCFFAIRVNHKFWKKIIYDLEQMTH